MKYKLIKNRKVHCLMRALLYSRITLKQNIIISLTNKKQNHKNYKKRGIDECKRGFTNLRQRPILIDNQVKFF